VSMDAGGKNSIEWRPARSSSARIIAGSASRPAADQRWQRFDATPTFTRFSNGANGPRVLVFCHTNFGVSLIAATARAQSYPTQTYPTTPAYSTPNTYRPAQRHIVELRATMCLARRLRDTGRGDEVRAMLTEIYNWFTEGFDTADFKDARHC
jgi:hypothetical protein